MASSSKSKSSYDVFLSFTRWGLCNEFISCLRNGLDQNGICIFWDSDELRKGEQISPVLMEAIEDSRIAIIVFLEDYASSEWHLEELAKIMECKKQNDLYVLPVFYKVNPREVRSGTESYGRALAKHEYNFGKDSKKVKRWKKALFDAGNLSGWHFHDGDELELVRRIVKEISAHRNRTALHVANYPVGIDSRVAKLQLMLNLKSNDDVVMVGLWGQGGIGKTTLAKALYNAISRQFEGSCFLANVRAVSKNHNNLILLQENLLSTILSLRHRLELHNVDVGRNILQHRLRHKKVLIVLDDVDELYQLRALVGECKWFGNGSRIIVTTRDIHLLTCHGIDRDHVYEVKALDDIEALELLSNHAFKTHKSPDIRTDLVNHVLNLARGLPLALEVMGSILCGRREEEWEDTLKELTSTPNEAINVILRRSYDGLEENEREIFLHIACFFNQWSSEYVKKVLHSCDFDATIGLQILIERSFLSIDENGLLKVPYMIQLMGMNIVREECPDDLGRRSRLWLYEDVVNVLSSDMGHCAVKAIVLEPPEPIEIYINPHAFTKMRRLRMLIIRNVRCSSEGPIVLPHELKWFEWPELASQTLEISSTSKKSVGLNLSIQGIWPEQKKSVGLDLSKRGILVEPKVEPKRFEALRTSVATVEHVIGIDDRVKDVIKLLDIEDDEVEVRIVGIHGTNGIGKTTIAKAVYDRLSSCFDSCSFLAEIEETTKNGHGIQFVQTKLICDILEQDGDVASFEGGIEFFLDVFRDIKALIVLDDVKDQSYLNALVGDKLDWFGPGSRIIVTSENGEILQEYESRHLARIYEVNGMDDDRALELFCNHALGTHGSIYDHLEAAERIIRITGQVPFFIELIAPFLETAERIIEGTGQVPYVIEVIGSFLRGKPVGKWSKTEDLIKSVEDCREILKICYEALHEKQKQVFWDIAWFANGEDSRIASYMWPDRDLLDSQHFFMPLAKIRGDNTLWMHKLLKRLSTTIDQEETEYPGRCSRRYMHVTNLEEINRKEGTEEVEALCFDLNYLHPHTFKGTDFKSMPNIRFLKLDHARMTGNFANVFPRLRWLRWRGCPQDFVAKEFSLTELVILDLSRSKVTKEWGGWRLIKMEQLNVLNLTGCTDLLVSPKFSSFPNLEILILERCSRLVHLDPSIGGLEKLLCLNLKSCTELNKLPNELGALEALKELLIDETSVRIIPLGSYSKELETLSAFNCVSLSLPNGVGELVKLRRLSLRNCHWIQKLPESIGQSPLEELDISGTGISELPDSFGDLEGLRVLKMDYCFISKFPSLFWHLYSLEEIHACSCRNIGEIPKDIGELKNLRILRLRDSAICILPPEIKHLPKLETLDVLHCDKLHELPGLPSSLIIVHLSPELKEKVSHLWDKHCFISV